MHQDQIPQQYFNSQQLHRNQNSINYYLEPSLQLTKSDLQSVSKLQNSILNNQIDSPTMIEMRQHKKFMQIFGQELKNKYMNFNNNYLTEQVKRNQDNLEDMNAFIQKQNFMLLNNKVKQNSGAKFNDFHLNINEKPFKTCRFEQKNEDKKKSKSQHQQNLSQKGNTQLQQSQQCTQGQGCICTQCQLKVLQNKLMMRNLDIKKQENNLNSQLKEQINQQVISLNYSTQENNQIQTNKVNTLLQNQWAIKNYQTIKSSNNQPSSYYIAHSQFNQPQNSNNINLPAGSRISLNGSTYFNEVINQEQQHVIEQQIQQDYLLNQQEDISKEQMLSQMCEQNTQLQQLIKEQQDYIQILYQQMVQYQNLLDCHKIQYTGKAKNKLQVSESNFSLQGSTAAQSPIISQVCHSSRTSELGQLDLVDSSNQEQYNQQVILEKNQQRESFKQIYDQFNKTTSSPRFYNNQQQQQQNLKIAKQIQTIQNKFFSTAPQDRSICQQSNNNLQSYYYGSSNILNSSSGDDKQTLLSNRSQNQSIQQRRKSIFNQNQNQIQLQDSNQDSDYKDSSNCTASLIQKHQSYNNSPVRLHQNIKNLCLSTTNLEKKLQYQQMTKSARYFSSTSSQQHKEKNQIDLTELMQSFKNRFKNFLQNIKNKPQQKTSQFGRKNKLLIDKSLLEKSAIQNILKQQMFMSPQNSPKNKNIQNIIYNQIIKQDQKYQSNQYQFEKKPQMQYFSQLDKIIQSQKLNDF